MNYEMNLQKYADFVRSEGRLMIPRDLLESEQDVLALSNAFGGEAGELQNIVKKILSKDKFYDASSDLHDKFVLEAGDVLWYLFRLIQKSGYTIEHIMEKNIEKLQEKYKGEDTWRK